MVPSKPPRVWTTRTANSAATGSPWDTWSETWTANCSHTVTSETAWTVWNLCQQTLVRATTSSATYDTSWTNWNRHGVGNRIHRGTVEVVETPQSRAALARMREQAAQQQRERDNAARLEAAVRQEAKEKAFKLLDSVLTPPQKEELKTKGFFTCKSKIGNTYRIYRGSHGNVKKVVGNKEVESLCVQPAYVPEGDCMLAQKFHIENDEEGFRKTANISRLN